jgi:biopolymer transport protein ExbD
MRRRDKLRPYDDLNVTPLLDLAWVLLLVFIMMATAVVQGISVDLPRASNAPGLAKPRTHAVTVTADGRLFFDTTAVTPNELRLRLEQLKAVDPNPPIVVKGDAAARYEQVIAALDLVKSAKITNVGLVTQKLVK